MTLRLLVADDQELVREGLVTILDGEPDLSVVATAADGVEAVQQARDLAPDVVLMDIRMPRLDGIAATRRIVEQAPDVRVLVLTTFDEDALVLEALQAGASGFLLKDVPRRRLVESVRAVGDGELPLSSSITRRLVERHLGHRRPDRTVTAALARLSEREVEVLGLVAAGASNGEVAATLHLSESTVKTHVGRLLHKVGARDRVHLVIFAYSAGLAG